MTDSSSSHATMRQRGRVAYPTLAWVCQQPSRFIAFGFGVGLLRPASGTWGTLLAWLMGLALPHGISNLGVGLFLMGALVYGCWACDRVGKALNHPDHVGMVWDEMVAFWGVLWLVPATAWVQTSAFLLFRFFDIVKPVPIRYVDARVKGGIGVMLDDLLAAAYTLVMVYLGMAFFNKWGG